MPRYVDVDAFRETVLKGMRYQHDKQLLINHSYTFPTADVKAVTHSHWVRAERRGCVIYHDSYAECSNCHGEPLQFCRDFKYCPWCGAKMDEEQKNILLNLKMKL